MRGSSSRSACPRVGTERAPPQLQHLLSEATRSMKVPPRQEDQRQVTARREHVPVRCADSWQEPVPGKLLVMLGNYSKSFCSRSNRGQGVDRRERLAVIIAGDAPVAVNDRRQDRFRLIELTREAQSTGEVEKGRQRVGMLHTVRLTRDLREHSECGGGDARVAVCQIVLRQLVDEQVDGRFVARPRSLIARAWTTRLSTALGSAASTLACSFRSKQVIADLNRAFVRRRRRASSAPCATRRVDLAVTLVAGAFGRRKRTGAARMPSGTPPGRLRVKLVVLFEHRGGEGGGDGRRRQLACDPEEVETLLAELVDAAGDLRRDAHCPG